MPKNMNPSALLGTQLAELWFESSVVMTLRLAQMSCGTVTSSESQRMVAEKPPAFARAGNRAMTVALRSLAERPYDPVGAYFEAASAYTASVARQVRGNRRRLTKV